MPKRNAYRETLPWDRRIFAGSVVIVAHLALLISFQRQAAPVAARPEPGREGVSISIAELAAPLAPPKAAIAPAPSASPPPPPKADQSQPEPIEHPEDLGLPAPRTDLEPIAVNRDGATPPPMAMAGVTAPDDPCHFTQVLQSALQGDASVRYALTLIPRDSRSVANAIMVWDGQWVAVNALGGDASLEPVRAAIVQSLRATSPACLARFNSGPLFVTIPGWPETTVLALGSGQWRAADLIAQAAGIAPTPTPTAPQE